MRHSGRAAITPSFGASAQPGITGLYPFTVQLLLKALCITQRALRVGQLSAGASMTKSLKISQNRHKKPEMKILITGICGFAGSVLAEVFLEARPGLSISQIENFIQKRREHEQPC
jgi:hypothetical protein